MTNSDGNEEARIQRTITFGRDFNGSRKRGLWMRFKISSITWKIKYSQDCFKLYSKKDLIIIDY